MEDNKIIDVEFVSANLKDKNNEELTKETNQLWSQMNAIGTLGMMMAAEAGERLKVIKSRIPHGEWEIWMEENLDFSPRKAKNMMKLAEKSGDINSIFSNRQTFADIGISKIWALLSAPEDVAEKVVKEELVEDLTVRELKQKLKDSEEEKGRLRDEWEKSKKLQKEIDLLKKEKDEAESKQDDSEELRDSLDKKERELKELKTQMKESVKEQLGKELRNLESKQQKEIESKIQEEREKTEKEIEEKMKKVAEKSEQEKKKLTEELNEAYKNIKKLEKLSDPAVEQFKIRVDVLQEAFGKCVEAADESGNPDSLKGSLSKLLDMMKKQI